jgi:hypothetical protein
VEVEVGAVAVIAWPGGAASTRALNAAGPPEAVSLSAPKRGLALAVAGLVTARIGEELEAHAAAYRVVDRPLGARRQGRERRSR